MTGSAYGPAARGVFWLSWWGAARYSRSPEGSPKVTVAHGGGGADRRGREVAGHRRAAWVVTLVSFAAVLGAADCAAAAGGRPVPRGARILTADLPARAGVRLVNAPQAPGEADPVAPAGDVNGDGVPDVIVGARTAASNGLRDSGVAYVVFGQRAGGTVDLERLGSRGFRIDGAPSLLPVELDAGGPAGERAGSAVAGIGDVNGDGLADVVVGSPYASPRGRALAGAVYVVFGRRAFDPVELGALRDGGYRIDGAVRGDFAGSYVGTAGDVNGDGRDDVVLSGGRDAAVVFTKGSPDPVDLAAPGPGGFRIAPPVQEPGGGVGPVSRLFPVSGAGDANGDGLADVVVGVPDLNARGREGSGAAFVVFGGRTGEPVELARLAARGYELDGDASSVEAGSAVAPAGDVNGDGLGDMVVGEPAEGAQNDGSDEHADFGAAFIVFGRRAPGRFDLGRLGARGVAVYGEPSDVGARLGTALAPLGDVNGDGLADVVLGAPGADGNCRPDAGSVYVVYGRRTAGRVQLGRLAGRGYRIDGVRRGDRVGAGLAAVGDLTGDGKADVWIGSSAPGSEESGPSGPIPPRTTPRPIRLASGAPPASRARGLPESSCLVAEPVTRSLRAIVRTRRLRVRVTTRTVVGKRADVFVIAYGLGRRGSVQGLAIGSARFLRPGTRLVTLTLSARTARLLQRRHPTHLGILAGQGVGGDQGRRGSSFVRLRR